VRLTCHVEWRPTLDISYTNDCVLACSTHWPTEPCEFHSRNSFNLRNRLAKLANVLRKLEVIHTARLTRRVVLWIGSHSIESRDLTTAPLSHSVYCMAAWQLGSLNRISQNLHKMCRNDCQLKSKLWYSNAFQNASMPNEPKSWNFGWVAAHVSTPL